ncbi:MAG: NAD-dependent epimerase/dehydratase family protein [Rhodopseudomonas sp.]|nr:NAD-dependent epimerase/dehydratase family protein [Rhodopseudomonas sp.]
MRVLVTGAAGFLGSHLVDALLARGDDVVAFGHRLHGGSLSGDVLARVRAIEADIFDADVVASAAQGCAAIYHCAAIVGVDAYGRQPARTMETEEVGLRHVCKAALAQGAAAPVVVYASSSAVYGHAGGAAKLDESIEVAPTSNYGIAKRYGELYLSAQHAEHGLNSTAFRIFNIYGPRQDERLVLPRFIRQALAGDPLELFGAGDHTRDFVFVSDVVAAMLAASNVRNGHQIVNACSGEETSVLALAQSVIRLAHSQSRIVHKPQPANRAAFEVARSFGSRVKLEELYGPLPRTSLESGLTLTIDAIAQRGLERPAGSVAGPLA